MKRILQHSTLCLALLSVSTANADVTVGRNGGWMYIEGPDGSCGPGAVSPVSRWLRASRTISWDDEAMWTSASSDRSTDFQVSSGVARGSWEWTGDIEVWISVYDGFVVGGLVYIGDDGPKCSDTWMSST